MLMIMIDTRTVLLRYIQMLGTTLASMGLLISGGLKRSCKEQWESWNGWERMRVDLLWVLEMIIGQVEFIRGHLEWSSLGRSEIVRTLITAWLPARS